MLRHLLFFGQLTYTPVMLPAAVQNSIEKFEMLAPDHRVLIGVSGGADSVCLLLVLKGLGYDVAVAHLNHGFRGAESDGDEAFTQNLCTRLDVPFHSRRALLTRDRGNLEAMGREARKTFFADLVARHAFDRVALAHNRDDRVETFLLNLFRGSGVEGLTSMEPISGNLVRPLLEIPRSEIEAYLQDRSQAWRNDSTNQTRQFARNRLRMDVIPRLAAEFNPRLAEALNRTTEILSDEDALLRELTDRWLTSHGTRNADTVVIDAEALALESIAIQRRVLREAIRRVDLDFFNLQDVSFDRVEAARELLGPLRSGKRVEVPGGVTLTRSFGQLIVETCQAGPEEFDYRLQIPGEVHIPELKRRFRATIVAKGDEGNGQSSPDRVFVDGSNIGAYVRIRNWKPGDYYRPVGLPAGKLKKLFQRGRIPRSQRHRCPVFVADTSIVWVASFPVAREFAPRGCSQKIVAFEALPI